MICKRKSVELQIKLALVDSLRRFASLEDLKNPKDRHVLKPVRSHFQSSIPEFLKTGTEEVLGYIAKANEFDLNLQQKNSWVYQIDQLRAQLGKIDNLADDHIFFEFAIPRMGKRVDVLLLLRGLIFLLEYKVGAERYDRSAMNQVVDYALDLKNFHEGSHSERIVPIVVATGAPETQNELEWHDDGVAKPLMSNGQTLIYVPQGNVSDYTRNPEFYDSTYLFLQACGLPVLSSAAKRIAI